MVTPKQEDAREEFDTILKGADIPIGGKWCNEQSKMPHVYLGLPK